MKLLICGGRDFNDYKKLEDALIKLPFIPSIIIEGGAKGADSLARKLAINNNIHYAEVPALWDNFDNRAGSMRNSAMMILKPDYCMAMPGGSGTHDMINKCKSAGVSVWMPYD